MNHASYHAGQFLCACLALITPAIPTRPSFPPYLLGYDDLCLWYQLPFTQRLISALVNHWMGAITDRRIARNRENNVPTPPLVLDLVVVTRLYSLSEIQETSG